MRTFEDPEEYLNWLRTCSSDEFIEDLMEKSTIVQAAIIYKDKLYVGHRHHNIIGDIHEETGDFNIFGEQGFITNFGFFVNRKLGAEIAFRAGQIKEPKKILFSEDLY